MVLFCLSWIIGKAYGGPKDLVAIDIGTLSLTSSQVHVCPSLEQGVIVVRYLKFEIFMYVSFMFMIVFQFHPIEKCPP
jgi:hypothetical protein